jgi:hypothetical protein
MIIVIIAPKHTYKPVTKIGDSFSISCSWNSMIIMVVNEIENKTATAAVSLLSALMESTSIMIITNMATNVLTMMMYT